MSQRRKLGDKVWVRRGAAFGQSKGEWAVIAPEPSYKAVPDDYTQRCPYKCGDKRCRQWPHLESDAGEIFRYVTECEMFDEEPYHKTKRS